MLCTMALARWVGVASQAALPRPNWSHALNVRTRSRTDAADAAGALHSAPARPRTTPMASARNRGTPFTTDMCPAPQRNGGSWLIAARGDRDTGGSGVDRQVGDHPPTADP